MQNSFLNERRVQHSTVTTQAATFLFVGGWGSTYEYLPKDSTTWLKGKTEIPGGFETGCAIAVKAEAEESLLAYTPS